MSNNISASSNKLKCTNRVNQYKCNSGDCALQNVFYIGHHKYSQVDVLCQQLNTSSFVMRRFSATSHLTPRHSEGHQNNHMHQWLKDAQYPWELTTVIYILVNSTSSIIYLFDSPPIIPWDDRPSSQLVPDRRQQSPRPIFSRSL